MSQRRFLAFIFIAASLSSLALPTPSLALSETQKNEIEYFLTPKRKELIEKSTKPLDIEPEMLTARLIRELLIVKRLKERKWKKGLQSDWTVIDALKEYIISDVVGIARISPDRLLKVPTFCRVIATYAESINALLTDKEKETWLLAQDILKQGPPEFIKYLYGKLSFSELRKATPEFVKYLTSERVRPILTQLLEIEPFNFFGAAFIIRNDADRIKQAELEHTASNWKLAGHSKDWTEEFRRKVADAYRHEKYLNQAIEQLNWYKAIKEYAPFSDSSSSPLNPIHPSYNVDECPAASPLEPIVGFGLKGSLLQNRDIFSLPAKIPGGSAIYYGGSSPVQKEIIETSPNFELPKYGDSNLWPRRMKMTNQDPVNLGIRTSTWSEDWMFKNIIQDPQASCPLGLKVWTLAQGEDALRSDFHR